MVKLVMLGRCPNCHATIVSRFPFQIGECKCKNPVVQVPLKLAIIPAKRHVKKLEEIARFRDVSVKKLIKELLDVWL